MSASDFAGGEDTPLEAALDMIKRDELNVRIHLYNDMNSYEDFTPVKEFADKIKSDFVQMPGVKAFYDGTKDLNGSFCHRDPRSAELHPDEHFQYRDQ